MPPFINVIDEVTDDSKYRNSEIARQIKKGLEIQSFLFTFKLNRYYNNFRWFV